MSSFHRTIYKHSEVSCCDGAIRWPTVVSDCLVGSLHLKLGGIPECSPLLFISHVLDLPAIFSMYVVLHAHRHVYEWDS
jgi:hypothetical protein